MSIPTLTLVVSELVTAIEAQKTIILNARLENDFDTFRYHHGYVEGLRYTLSLIRQQQNA